MSMNFKQNVIKYVKGIVERKKNLACKDKWETLDVIPFILLIGVNNCQPVLHMSKRMVRCYYTDETINQF